MYFSCRVGMSALTLQREALRHHGCGDDPAKTLWRKTGGTQRDH